MLIKEKLNVMNLKKGKEESSQVIEITSYEGWLSLLDVLMLYRSMLIRVTERFSANEIVV